MRDISGRRWAIIGVVALIAGAIVTALAVGRPWSSEPLASAEPSGVSTQGIVNVMPEPTATGPNGLPIAPSDPFRPPATMAPGVPSPTGPPSTFTSPPMPSSIPSYPSMPSIHAPPPTPPTVPSMPASGKVRCDVWIQPGFGTGRDSIRLIVQGDPDVTVVWARVISRTGTQTGTVHLMNGYGEQVVPGASLQGTSVLVYGSPDMSQRSESCRFG